MKKKLFAILLAAVLMMSCFPITADAAGENDTEILPIYTGDAEVDYGAKLILDELDLEGKDDRGKIQAVYDWMILNCERNGESEVVYYAPDEYREEIEEFSQMTKTQIAEGKAIVRQNMVNRLYTPSEEVDEYSYRYDESKRVAANAYAMMVERIGSCVSFSSLTAVLLGQLGYDCRLISGNFLNSDGTTPIHTWNYTLVDGKYYWLDVRIDHANYTRTGEVTHQYFMERDTETWAKKHSWDHDYSDWLFAEEKKISILTTGSSPFADVKDSSAYYYVPVLWGTENGIVQGTSENTFSPNATCTRAQAVVFLYRLAGKPEIENAENPFEDVQETDYYYDAILWAYRNGIVNGVTENRFEPQVNVSRKDFVTLLYRLAGKPEIENAENPFEDIEEAAYYELPVLWAYQNGITSGTSAKTFTPDKQVTRAEVVTFLYRYAE